MDAVVYNAILNRAKVRHAQVFTSNGTWACPSGVNQVFITACGGGGGGGCAYSYSNLPGSAGGTTSFDVLLSLVGGSGGNSGGQSVGAGAGAGNGQNGETGFHNSGTGYSPEFGGSGGASLGPQTSRAGQVGAYPTAGNNGKLGAGGSGASGQSGGSTGSACGGGGADWVKDHPINVTSGTVYNITIGAGGSGGTGGSANGGSGGAGYMKIVWYA